jgi:hypothetical protein
MQHPTAFYFCIYNNPKSARQGKQLKDIGLMAGVADNVLINKSKMYFFEFKTPKGRQSPEQMYFQRRCEVCGVDYHVIRSIDEFISIINGILK